MISRVRVAALTEAMNHDQLQLEWVNIGRLAQVRFKPNFIGI